MLLQVKSKKSKNSVNIALWQHDAIATRSNIITSKAALLIKLI